jgi:geranylgeranyl pyrophosphate synthase
VAETRGEFETAQFETAQLDTAQIERATYLVEACGGREWTAVRAKANLDAALGALERVRLSAIPHRDLADLAVYVVERDS